MSFYYSACMHTKKNGRRSESVSTKYSYVLVLDDGQWSANYPDLGCWGIGSTRAEAVADLKKAARLMIEYLGEIGESLPVPRLGRPSHLLLVRLSAAAPTPCRPPRGSPLRQ